MACTPAHCPRSSHIPPATLDEDGFCSEHGWDCGDFSISDNQDDEGR